MSSKDEILARIRGKRGNERVANSVSRKLKEAGIKDVSPVAVEKIRKKLIPFRPTRTNNNVTIKKAELAVAEHLAGKSQAEAEAKYGVSNGYINQALKRMFPDRAKLEELLENVTLENALSAHEIFHNKKDEMTAKEAAIASGIHTQRYIDIKKARGNNFQEQLPVGLILKLDATLQNVEKRIEGRVIEEGEE